MSATNPPPRPPFTSLPLDPSGPPGNAWGLYGPADELGALNMLTPSLILRAASEIQCGERVSLDWALDLPTYPSFNRRKLEWKMTQKKYPDGGLRSVNDDEVSMNTQGGSQWDGFRHYGYQGREVYFGGRGQGDLRGGVIGIDRVAESGGITTRAVVLDYPRYLARKGRASVSALEANSIKVDELDDMLKETGVQTREGDLLLLRTGFTEQYLRLNDEERKGVAERPPAFLGVESTGEVLKWIWEHGFVAVAGDAPSFEMSPLVGEHNKIGGIWKGESWEEEMQGGGLIHQWCLAGWGVMIGELWDLERLVEMCEKLGRWTCFVSSVPLKIPGGVASPPNAVAIF
ncbi:hypothetical protein K491DRAFT_662693 [Lophiostoma macrostomum CBS 122681]|uniref:Cyclase n=1 Tax=Lophiostoma macrostomum CBS 122681 TaxID=1314788 RepID=A0A6A6T292_9PLEO|nr:hypothetical protein K491DRAFT_662693 [Lophiostoma macrostomum CBS 122681]